MALTSFILVHLVCSCMLKIGLTGGIGSGKSTVSTLFEQLNTPVIDADIIAHQLVAVGQPALAKIQQTFGSNILQLEGSLDRKKLRELVFSNPLEKQKLEAIIHPLVYQSIQTEIKRLTAPYCIISIPLLFESNMTSLVDRILVVDCSEEQQIERLLKRDDMTTKRIQSIINSQISRDFRNSKANDLIDNSGSNDRLAEQVKTLHNFYISISICQDTLFCD